MDQAGIQTFRDDPSLEKGERISSGICNAIQSSKMFVVVISENYARSSWCLDELVEILGCRRTENQVVPVFYYVDPSNLRHQKGSFGDALDFLKKRYSVNKIEQWKSALAEIADLSGYHLKKDADEDIVFFSIGKDKDEGIHVFRSCGFSPGAGIPILVERCLLTVDEDNKFQMHSLIQDMGRPVILEESNHGKCRRLKLYQGNPCHTLQTLEETGAIEGLIIDLTLLTEKYFSAKMGNVISRTKILLPEQYIS